MAMETRIKHEQQEQEQQARQRRQGFTLADVIDQLVQFDGPPEQFLAAMLQVQCKIAPAAGGAVLRLGKEGQVDLLAAYPQLKPGATAPVWLAKAVEQAPAAARNQETAIVPIQSDTGIYESAPTNHLILLPIRAAGILGMQVFFVQNANAAVVARARERLELTSSLLNLYEMRKALQKRNVDLERLRESMEVLASANEHPRMKAAAFALCNEVASRWDGQRVSLGFLKGRYVKVVAMSHTEKFTRKMKLVQDIESAMEECLDQDLEVIYPAPTDVHYVSRAAKQLVDQHGPTTVLSLPLRRDGKVVAVITVERAVDKPWTVDEIETLRLMCDLVTARLIELHEHDRWFGAKLADKTKKSASWVVGAEHTWLKLIVLAVLGFLLFAIFVKGSDKVDATFVVEPRQKQIVTAPFAGFIKEVYVEPGDHVLSESTATALASSTRFTPYMPIVSEIVSRKSQLALMSTEDLQDQIIAAYAEKARYEKEADQAQTEGNEGAKQIALAKVDQVEAQIRLLRHQESQSMIRAQIDGVVVSTTDLKQQIGVAVEPKTTLFEIAPLETLRAELAVPENRIADLEVGDFGELSAAAAPGEYFAFEVERIDPVAQVIEQQNVFIVRARLLPQDEQTANLADLRAGMKGVAKVTVGREPYGYLWTKDLVNWIRMKLWL